MDTNQNRVVVFTGQAANGQDRAFWSSMAQEAGFVVKNSVTSQTDLLVSSYQAAKDGSAKWLKAKDKGVAIISYGQFLDEVEQTMN